MPDLDQRLQIIEQRNQRVEADKAWEVSWVRRGVIAGVTYMCALIILKGEWVSALVPVIGYIVSTLSLPAIKKMWIKQRLKNKNS